MGIFETATGWLLKVYQSSPRFIYAIGATTALLLFLPGRALALFGASAAVAQYRPWIFLVFLFSFTMIVSYPVQWCWKWAQRKIGERGYKKAVKERLARLDTNEKAALRPYISDNRRNRYFYFNDGTVANLRHCCVLFIPDTPGAMFDKERVPHVMVDWVWDYLHEHPKLLK